MVPPDVAAAMVDASCSSARRALGRRSSGVSKSAGTTIRRSSRPSASGPSTAALSTRARPRCAPRLRALELEARAGSGDRRATARRGRRPRPRPRSRAAKGTHCPGPPAGGSGAAASAHRQDDDLGGRKASISGAKRGSGGSDQPQRRQQPQRIGRAGAEQARDRAADGEHDAAWPGSPRPCSASEPGDHDFSAFSSASISAMSASLRSVALGELGDQRRHPAAEHPVDQPAAIPAAT